MRVRKLVKYAFYGVLTILLINLIVLNALAYTNPELLQLVEKIMEYALKGLQEYFNFLLELFKEAVKHLV